MLSRYHSASELRRRAFWQSITSAAICGGGILIVTVIRSIVTHHATIAGACGYALVFIALAALIAVPLAWFVSSLAPGEKRNHTKPIWHTEDRDDFS